jgi:inosine-uridine nucleoside N-ribohydrolase
MQTKFDTIYTADEPVKIILDTDIGPDCDDAGAIAVLHTLATQGAAEILGIAHCTSNMEPSTFIPVTPNYPIVKQGRFNN